MEYYTSILNIHSIVACITLLALIIAVINSFIGLSKNRVFKLSNRRFALIGLIMTHIQFVVGLILYFVSPKTQMAFKDSMKDSLMRLYNLEHPLIILIAVTLITIGWSKHKKTQNSKSKFKKIAIFYTIGLLLILSRIPWKIWLG